jgi:hypothetical protein
VRCFQNVCVCIVSTVETNVRNFYKYFSKEVFVFKKRKVFLKKEKRMEMITS